MALEQTGNMRAALEAALSGEEGETGFAIVRDNAEQGLDVVWPSREQAEISAGFCSYPVKIVPVRVIATPPTRAEKG